MSQAKHDTELVRHTQPTSQLKTKKQHIATPFRSTTTDIPSKYNSDSPFNQGVFFSDFPTLRPWPLPVQSAGPKGEGLQSHDQLPLILEHLLELPHDGIAFSEDQVAEQEIMACQKSSPKECE